jgi:hypothetical protein
MGERFDNVGASAGAPLRAGFFLLTLIVLAVRWRRLGLGEREFSAGAFLAALGLFALALTPVLSTAGDRIGYYAVPLQMMVLPRAALSLSSRRCSGPPMGHRHSLCGNLRGLAGAQPLPYLSGPLPHLSGRSGRDAHSRSRAASPVLPLRRRAKAAAHAKPLERARRAGGVTA